MIQIIFNRAAESLIKKSMNDFQFKINIKYKRQLYINTKSKTINKNTSNIKNR